MLRVQLPRKCTRRRLWWGGRVMLTILTIPMFRQWKTKIMSVYALFIFWSASAKATFQQTSFLKREMKSNENDCVCPTDLSSACSRWPIEWTFWTSHSGLDCWFRRIRRVLRDHRSQVLEKKEEKRRAMKVCSRTCHDKMVWLFLNKCRPSGIPLTCSNARHIERVIISLCLAVLFHLPSIRHKKFQLYKDSHL